MGMELSEQMQVAFNNRLLHLFQLVSLSGPQNHNTTVYWNSPSEKCVLEISVTM